MALLTGGIKNALERGENSDIIAKSFISAGYSQDEVQKAISELNPLVTSKNIQNSLPEIKQTQSGFKSLPSTSPNIANSIINDKTKKSYWEYILLAILGILIISGSAILGLYWRDIFG